MYDRLISYIIQHKILFPYQFGFQKGKSTHMALITLVDKITEALGKGDYVIVYFLIFQKRLTLLIIPFYWRKCSPMASGM